MLKKLSILAALLILMLPVSAADFYKPENITNGQTYDQACDDWAISQGYNPAHWQAKPSGGYAKVRWYWWSGSGFSYSDYEAPAGAVPSTIWTYPGDYAKAMHPTQNIGFVQPFFYCCNNGTTSCAGKWPYNYTWSNSSRPPPADADFSGYPLDGYAPLPVAFTISNFTAINATGATFTWGDGQINVATSAAINHTYQNPGIYSVSMAYFNTSGTSKTVTKTNYVLASVPSGLAVNLDIKNAITGVLVQDSTVGIRNTSTGVWRNTTAPTGLVYFTSTDPGYLYPLSQNQSITLAANKSGYQDASTTFNIPYNNYRSILYMMPTSIINATGNGTVVVNVIRALNGLTVSGMSVALDTGHVGITNTAGAVTLFNVTAGERTASVTDPDGAYLPTEKAFVLSAGETKLVTVYVARDDDPPIDPDDPFTSPTPTPTRTYDPNDPSSPVYGNYTTSEINQQGGAGVLAMLAQLIALWPAIVVFAFLKFMRSAMS